MKALVLTILIAALVVPGAMHAKEGATEQVVDTARFMLGRATCKNMTDAIEGFEYSAQPTRDILLFILFTTYLAGYAAGADLDKNVAQEHIFLRCIRAPDAFFVPR